MSIYDIFCLTYLTIEMCCHVRAHFSRCSWVSNKLLKTFIIAPHGAVLETISQKVIYIYIKKKTRLKRFDVSHKSHLN